MSARLLADANGAAVYHATWCDLLPVVAAAGGCDAMFADTPYSAKTHEGHDAGVSTADNMAAFSQRNGGQAKDRTYAARKAAAGASHRRELNYPPFTPADVQEFVGAWHPLIRGWFTTITDDILAPVWRDAFAAVGRYVFSPLPYVAPGSRVRMTGDGPACWSNWIVVARPADGAWLESWRARRKALGLPRALPGAYVLPPGQAVDMPVVGGKQPWLLCEMLNDYTLPGDLCVDATCGAGTTAAAAIRTGRRAIVGDAMQAHAEMAARWITDPQPKCPTAIEARQGVLFGGG